MSKASFEFSEKSAANRIVSKGLHGSSPFVENYTRMLSRRSAPPFSSPDVRHKPERTSLRDFRLVPEGRALQRLDCAVRSKWRTASNWTARLAWK